MPGRNTETVTLIFRREELLYDVRNYAFVEADIMPVEDEHGRHQVMDIGEDGNVDRVTRVLDLSIAQLRELCYPYTKMPVDGGAPMDDTLQESGSYVLSLNLPEGFSHTTVELLLRMIHELLVYKVLADWMSITKPSAEENWQRKIDALEGGIRTALNTRRGRVRRVQSPF